MEKIKTMAVALLLAAVVPAVAFTLYFLFLVLFAALAGRTNGVELKTSFVIFLAALTISTAHVVFLGLPAVWLLNKLNQLRLWTVVAAGLVSGCIPIDEPGKAKRWRSARDSRGRGPRRSVTVAPLSRRTVAAKLHAASPEGTWHTGRAKCLLRAAALRAIWYWPVEYSGYRSSYSYWDGEKMVQAKIDGIPTLVGWIDYSKGVALMGALGAIAALSFWWAWKRLRHDKSL